jgi:hypothetical protein
MINVMKYRTLFAVILTLLVIFANISHVHGYELSGYASIEGHLFFNDALYDGQKRSKISLALQPDFYHEWEGGSSVTFTPFARLDSTDPERSHFDIRELNYLLLHDRWELRIGVSKVFWGVTEFVHLVDIINQTDLVEYIDGEDKLGQPMVDLSMPGDRGVIDLFVLPYFRERTFPGRKGRFRSPVVVDTDGVIYESSAEERHIDFAVRYSHTMGDWDFGVYYFLGTGREPTLLPGIDSGGNPLLVPFYEQIGQTGVDLQTVKGNWLFKLESLYRTGQTEDFFACAGGFEYSLVNIASTGMDLGLIGEWAYDDRGDQTTTGFDNDLMIGARLAFNDPEGTEVLMGLIQDLDDKGGVFSLESSRRLSDHWKAGIDAFFVLDSTEEDYVHSLRNDDSLRIELSYYF